MSDPLIGLTLVGLILAAAFAYVLQFVGRSRPRFVAGIGLVIGGMEVVSGLLLTTGDVARAAVALLLGAGLLWIYAQKLRSVSRS